MMLPNVEVFSKYMRRLDIRLSDRVVCYDTGERNMFGFRAAWMLEAMGHKKVQVLDGGLDLWVK